MLLSTHQEATDGAKGEIGRKSHNLTIGKGQPRKLLEKQASCVLSISLVYEMVQDEAKFAARA